MINSTYAPPNNSDPYACNTADLEDGYTFKILDINIFKIPEDHYGIISMIA